MVHLVYCDDKSKELAKILAGEKTMIIRGAAGRKIPHSRVFAGDTLYFMEKGSLQISASATVVAVENFVKLTDTQIDQIIFDRQPQLQLTPAQQERWHKKCLCLVAFDQVKPITPPLPFDHQNNMDDWIILDKIADAVVGTSTPYSYEKAKL